MKSLWRSLGAVAAMAAALTGAPALAQQTGPEGMWGCEMTYTALDNSGNRTSGYVKKYMMGVYQGGAMEARGSTLGVGGQSEFQAQGQWQVQQNMFMAQAQGMEQSAFGTMPTMFIMMGQLASDGRTMSFTNETPDPSRSYIMDRSIFMCQRQG